MGLMGPIGPFGPNGPIGPSDPNDIGSYWNYMDNVGRHRLDPTLGSRDPAISLNSSSDKQ